MSHNDSMWIPRSAHEILNALPDARETSSLEFKRELPAPSKNSDIAVDIASMSVDGGVIIYGVEEDKESTSFKPHPIPLSGQCERIDSIIKHRVGGELTISIATFADPESANESEGYLVVSVPQSPHAPHLVEGQGFFGRSATGNRLLSQGEVDRLYAQRAVWEISAQDRVNRARADSDLRSGTENSMGVLRVVVDPVTGRDDIRSLAGIDERGNQLLELAFEVKKHICFVKDPPFSLFDALNESKRIALGRGLRFRNSGANPQGPVEVDVFDNGRIVLSHGGILYHLQKLDQWVLVDDALAQITAHFLALAGAILEEAKFYGHINLALTIEGCSGAKSVDWATGKSSYLATMEQGALRGEPVEFVRCTADQLVGGRAVIVCRQLIRPILREVRPSHMGDPLETVF